MDEKNRKRSIQETYPQYVPGPKGRGTSRCAQCTLHKNNKDEVLCESCRTKGGRLKIKVQ